MKTTVLLLVSSLGSGGCAVTGSPSPATFSSVSLTSAHSTWCASAVPISNNLLLTVSHATPGSGILVVEGLPTHFRVIAGGKVAAADGEVETTFPIYVHDWAILSLDDIRASQTVAPGILPSPGDTVWLQGFPSGKPATLQGIVQSSSSFGPTVVPGEIYLVKGIDNAVVLEGASGGAILNSRGELVGIMVGVARNHSEESFWVVRKTQDLLD